MNKRKIGSSDLEVFPIGLGAMGMSEFYGSVDENESIKTLHAAIEHGVNFIDTADMYGIGKNEELLQKAFHDRWDKIVLSTKFGVEIKDDGTRGGVNGRPEYVKKACEASLKRLGRDSIDLYSLHRVDPNTPIEETVGAMAELVKEGKVRYIGLSEASGSTIRKANGVHPITSVQSEYSIWSTDIELDSLPVMRELGIALVAYSPLGRGFLTGQIKKFEDLAEGDFRRVNPRFMGENFDKNLELVKEVEEMAKQRNIKASQLALAWVLNQGNDIFPIPGTTKINNLIENIEAINIKLTQEEITKLKSTMTFISGTRYPEAGMKGINL
ncbi:MAG: aldo/keto reductase [Ignavibacteria bacterium]|nr:aldo/keto reductase [Ignavibacteria bacterium]